MAKLSFIKSISKNPIATGEAYSGISHFKNLINPDYIDIVQYDLTHSGDFDTCLKISELANSNSIEQCFMFGVVAWPYTQMLFLH